MPEPCSWETWGDLNIGDSQKEWEIPQNKLLSPHPKIAYGDPEVRIHFLWEESPVTRRQLPVES